MLEGSDFLELCSAEEKRLLQRDQRDSGRRNAEADTLCNVPFRNSRFEH